MKFGSAILLGVAGLAVLYYGKLLTAANDMIVLFKTVNILGVTDYQIVLTIQNPTNATIKLFSLAANVQINGNDFGNVSLFQEIDINPNTQQDLPLSLKVSILTMPQVIMNLYNTGRGSYDFTVNGTMNINGDVVPLTLDNTINL